MDIQSTSQVANTPLSSNGQAGATESRVKAAAAQTEEALKPASDADESQTARENKREGGIDIKV